MNYVLIDDIQRMAGLTIATILHLNTCHNDGMYLNERELVAWINHTFLIVSGSAIFDSMVDDQLLTVHTEGTVDITDKGMRLIEHTLSLYVLKD